VSEHQQEDRPRPRRAGQTQEQSAQLILRPTDTPFVMIPRDAVLDARMTLGALGVLNYLLLRATMPGGWTFYVPEIARHFDTGASGGEVRARLGELEGLGYPQRERVRGERGRLIGQRWTVSALPLLATREGRDGVQKGKFSTSRFSSRGAPTAGPASRGESSANKNDSIQNENNHNPPVAALRGVDVVRDAETEGRVLPSSPQPVSASRKGKRLNRAAEHQRLLEAYQSARVPGMVEHCLVPARVAPVLAGVIEELGGDVDGAVEAITLATRYVAAALGSWWKSGPPDLENVARNAVRWAGRQRTVESTLVPDAFPDLADWVPAEGVL